MEGKSQNEGKNFIMFLLGRTHDHGSHLLNWSSLARTGQAILLETDLRLLMISDIRSKKLSVVSSLGYAEGWI